MHGNFPFSVCLFVVFIKVSKLIVFFVLFFSSQFLTNISIMSINIATKTAELIFVL